MNREDWFTVEPIDHDTWVISEYGHPEETHSYVLRGRDRALLIDTGLGVLDIAEPVSRLTDLPTTAVTTHVHWDITRWALMRGLAAGRGRRVASRCSCRQTPRLFGHN